jgi:hydrogenase expression/formation protein HypD
VSLPYVGEYREGEAVARVIAEIRRVATRPWTIMEVCGGQTHALVRFGIEELLPDNVRLLHGPGCPVCVTPAEMIENGLQIAARPEVIFCTFGDMLRVPAVTGDLQTVKARGGDVRIVYSPMDALDLAKRHPDREVVFFAVGFETTAPANAMAVAQARAQKITNFSLLVSQVLIPPAMVEILKSPECRVDGFLGAGHVCTVSGFAGYHELARRFRVPIVVTGFEPLDLAQGILMCVRQLEAGRNEVENQYSRSVRPDGNPHALELIHTVFEIVDRPWRGLGVIPGSGLVLREEYREYDAELRFSPDYVAATDSELCQSGLVLQGRLDPRDCPEFGQRCTPEHPLGATMVSSEGGCAAYYRYGRHARTSGTGKNVRP